MRISDWSSGVCSSDLVADQSTDQLHDLVLVFAHEQFERALVTRLRADNELFVGNGIAHALMRFSRGRKTLHSQPRNSSKTRFSSGQRDTDTCVPAAAGSNRAKSSIVPTSPSERSMNDAQVLVIGSGTGGLSFRFRPAQTSPPPPEGK